MPKPQATKEKIKKLFFIKIKNFCASKDTINRVKMQPTEWEKIFSNHTSDNPNIFKIHTELLKLHNKKPNSI